MLLAWKLAPALAAGCTVVIKPSEFTSASTVELVRLIEEAGLPPGVVNVVTGFGAEVGAPLVEHPLVRKVSFTGSDATGRRIGAQAARESQALHPGAGREVAEHRVRRRRPRRRGQRRRLRHLRRHRADLHRRLPAAGPVDRARRGGRRAGRLARTAAHGQPDGRRTPRSARSPPAPQYQKVLDYIDIAQTRRRPAGPRRRRGHRPECGDGWFVEPTIFTGVDNGMRIAQEEVFGPVLAVIPFDDEDEAVASPTTRASASAPGCGPATSAAPSG